jgi:hypothetical protein
MGHRAGYASAPALPKGKAPRVRGFAFVINKEHGRGGFLANGTTAGCESQMARA